MGLKESRIHSNKQLFRGSWRMNILRIRRLIVSQVICKKIRLFLRIMRAIEVRLMNLMGFMRAMMGVSIRKRLMRGIVEEVQAKGSRGKWNREPRKSKRKVRMKAKEGCWNRRKLRKFVKGINWVGWKFMRLEVHLRVCA